MFKSFELGRGAREALCCFVHPQIACCIDVIYDGREVLGMNSDANECLLIITVPAAAHNEHFPDPYCCLLPFDCCLCIVCLLQCGGGSADC